MRNFTPWTDQQKDEIIGLYGMESASAIGARFNVGRNSICGLWHRARADGKLKAREVKVVWRENGSKPKKAKPAPKTRAPRPPKAPPTTSTVKLIAEARAARKAIAIKREAEIICDPVGFLDAKDCHCRYHIGKGRDGLAMFCGAQVEPDTSWCAGHARIVFQPLSKAPVSIRRAA